MAVIEAHEKHQELIDELIAAVSAYNADVDRDLIRRAFLFAANAHGNCVTVRPRAALE